MKETSESMHQRRRKVWKLRVSSPEKKQKKNISSTIQKPSKNFLLRFNNYLVSMMNKSLLPLRFNLPLLGDYVFLSSGLKFNLELILFKSPWAPFNQWHLRECIDQQLIIKSGSHHSCRKPRMCWKAKIFSLAFSANDQIFLLQG